MKALSRITIYGAFLMVLLVSGLGQNVQTDFDHQADFYQYKTYSWQAINAADSLWNARIKDAVNAQLATKGWTQADKGQAKPNNGGTEADTRGLQANNGPGFPLPPPLFPPPPPLVAAQAEPTSASVTSLPCVVIVAIQTTESQRSLQGFYDGFGGEWGWGGFGNSGTVNITEQEYKEGTLVIDMYDAKTKQLLWRGSAEGTLSDKANKNEQKLDKAVAKMFKGFPPASTTH